MKDIGEDDNFFDAGVSSLTIIELQIRVEDILEVTVPTTLLMRLSTIIGLEGVSDSLHIVVSVAKPVAVSPVPFL